MTRQLTPRQKRQALDATEVLQFTPSTHVATLRDRMNRGTFTTTGWIPPPHLSDEAWLETIATIRDLERATPWIWGDCWAARGSRNLPDDWDGPDQRTLDNYAILARAFPITRRRVNVSPSHHQALTGLSEATQDELLDWCAGPQRPALRELRAEIRRRAAPRLSPPEVTPSPATPPPKRSPREPESELEIKPEIEPPEIEIILPVPLSGDRFAQVADRAANKGMMPVEWVLDLIEKDLAP